MRRLLISALLLCSAPVSAQHLAPEDYIFPLRDVAGLYSANFGEMRPNHFHSGIDIKTDGVTGKPVLATADGYISRIAVTPGGYGRAIYITHPNGTTSVYGHLSKFRDDIEKYVHEERYRTRRNSINLYPPADRFPLKQGEQFAWSAGPAPSSWSKKHPDAMRSNRKEHSPSAAEVTSSWRRPTAKTTYPTHSDSGAYVNLQTKIRSSNFVSTASPSTRPATATPSPTTPCRSPRATK